MAAVVLSLDVTYPYAPVHSASASGRVPRFLSAAPTTSPWGCMLRVLRPGTFHFYFVWKESTIGSMFFPDAAS